MAKKNQYLNNKSKCLLVQISKKDKPWDNHKSENDSITKIFNKNNEKRFKKWAERTNACAKNLNFVWSEVGDLGEVVLKLLHANFCRVRTCPVCAWRRSMKNKARLLERLPKIEKKYKSSRWLFLTLTIENCDISDLKQTIKEMNYAFRKMKMRKNWKALGWIKTIEVTRAKDGKAHPHFHILLHMPASYFGKNYITQVEWIDIWQKALKVDYKPNLDIRAVKSNNRKSKNSIASVVAEIAKYATKPTTFIDHPEWFIKYSDEIHRMRFVDSGGTLRGILADNYDNLVEIEEGENKEQEESQNKADLIFGWESLIKHYVKK